MRSYGYTVNANDNYSEHIRRGILEFLVGSEIEEEIIEEFVGRLRHWCGRNEAVHRIYRYGVGNDDSVNGGYGIEWFGLVDHYCLRFLVLAAYHHEG